MSRLFSSLRFQLIAIVLLSGLPVFALLFYSGLEERESAALQARQSTKRLIELAATHQVRVIDEAHRLLVTVSETLSSHTADLEHCSAYLTEMLSRHPRYLNLGVIGANGKTLCSARPLDSHSDFSGSDYFLRAIEVGSLAIGSSQSDPATGKPSINFGFPLQIARETFVAFASVDLAWLSDLAAYLELSEGATLTVIDRQGTVIVRYPNPELWVGRVFPDSGVLNAALKKNGRGAVEAFGLDGVKRLYAFTPLGDPTPSLILYTGIPTSSIYAGANRALIRNLIALGLVTLMALMVACLLGHFVVMRRVNALIDASSRLAEGDLRARAGLPSGSSELEQLGVAFDAMAESLEKESIERDQMEAALRRSEERYRALVEQIPVVTYTAAFDEERTTLFISPQVESLLGFDSADFYQDRDAWLRRLHPEDRERVLKELSRCRREMDLFICEYRMLTFNGYVKWIRDEAVTVLSDSGQPLFIQGVMADITEQKKSEEELVKARNELEMRVEQRTKELAKANDDLRLSLQKLKSFAGSVVHDLKSPAIGAYGITKLLWKQYGSALDEKGALYCNQIMKASEHVVELAEKINVYITTKETPLHIESVNLEEILETLKEEFSERFAARSIGWVAPNAGIEVRADKLSLLRMFRNYIDNAMKYGGDQLSEIKIGYEETDNFHIFSVSDDGQGVSEEDAEKIFQMFERSSSSSGIEGTGLGLAIVREIAEKHGGKVFVQRGAGRGVTFGCSISKAL